jgi:hypothetical protein
MAADKTIRSDPHIPHAIQNPGPATYNSSFFSHTESIAISDFAQSALQKKRPHQKWQQNAIKMNESTTQHQTEYSLAQPTSDHLMDIQVSSHDNLDQNEFILSPPSSDHNILSPTSVATQKQPLSIAKIPKLDSTAQKP